MVPLQATVDLDLAWGADNFNQRQWRGRPRRHRPGDRSIAFANTTAGDNVVVRDVNGDRLPALTSNGDDDPLHHHCRRPFRAIRFISSPIPTQSPACAEDRTIPMSCSGCRCPTQALGIAVFELRGADRSFRGADDRCRIRRLCARHRPDLLLQRHSIPTATASPALSRSGSTRPAQVYRLRLRLCDHRLFRRCRAACSSISMTARIPIGTRRSPATPRTDLEGVSPKVIGIDNVERRHRRHRHRQRRRHHRRRRRQPAGRPWRRRPDPRRRGDDVIYGGDGARRPSMAAAADDVIQGDGRRRHRSMAAWRRLHLWRRRRRRSGGSRQRLDLWRRAATTSSGRRGATIMAARR